jgi:hypothetical protein
MSIRLSMYFSARNTVFSGRLMSNQERMGRVRVFGKMKKRRIGGWNQGEHMDELKYSNGILKNSTMLNNTCCKPKSVYVKK